MSKIHPTAIVSDKAKLGNNVEIAPYAIIHDDVEIGDDCFIGPHTVIYDGARIGNRVKFFQSASVANLPQDLKFENEETLFYIGDDTVIREFVTLHRGTKETNYSKVGNNCLIMAYAHVAHDCIIGNNCIIANSVQMGGHAQIDDWAIIGGLVAIHQFVQIGKHVMIGGGCRDVVDIPPFILAAHEPIRYSGINTVGLRRRNFSNDEIIEIKNAYNILYASGLNRTQAVERLINEFPDSKNVQEITLFLSKSTRSGFKK